jgi:predicted transport protein
MQALHREFTKIINGTTQFTIPVFQRDYTWTDINCEQLWKDVIRIGKSPVNRSHFLGSLVYTPSGDSSAGFTQYQVIDGQQRLTTWTLLMVALRDHITSIGYVGSGDAPTAKRIDAYFLKNEQEEHERRYKLVLRRKDHASLRALVDGQEVPPDTSEKIKENYELFRSLVATEDPTVIYRGLGRLLVVDVKLDPTDNPQLVFESLNSTGVDLSQSDLIRNFILMRLPEAEQNRLYEGIWSKLEELFRGVEGKFDSFARDYVALFAKSTKQEKAANIYRAFRDVFDDMLESLGSLDALLEHMYRFARYYAAFSLSVNAPSSLREPLARLRNLVDVPAILVMQLFETYEHLKTSTLEEFREALSLLESYVLRRSVCDGQSRGYWQVFADMAYELDLKKPLRSLKAALATQHESYAFPADSGFKAALTERDLYHMRNCLHILVQLENHGSKEVTDARALEIEHIMPQNQRLNADWRAMLGDNWKETQRVWLHRLGNLTLTGYNSKYSDRSFEEKKTIEHGFADSAVRLNKYVREQSKWTESEIRHRGGVLAKRATIVWPSLDADAAAIKEITQARLKRRAAKANISSIGLSELAISLFSALQQRILEIDPEATEMVEAKSISYHGPMFFLEVLPRKNKLSLLLPLEFNEITDEAGIATDATQWKFLFYAQHSGGVLLHVKNLHDIDAAVPIIKQAYEVTNGARSEPAIRDS